MGTRKRGRPPKIGFDQIVEAALRIGLRDLTMKQLARELNVAMSTLYHHVSGIDEVNNVVADRLITDVDVLVQGDEPLDLDHFLLAAGRRLRDMFASAPGFAEIARSSPRLNGRILAVHEKAARRLVDMGLAPHQAFLTIRAIADYVESMTARDELWALNGSVVEAVEQNQREAAAANYSTLTEAYNEIGGGDHEIQFEFGLKALASGLTTMALSTTN